MRNVERPKRPPSLTKNAARWRRSLLGKLWEYQRRDKKVPDIYFNKYKKKDIKNVLNRMYNGLCCYCESRVGIVDYPHIEHRKPKSTFPSDTFNWENLHLSCTKCNGAKGDKYDKNQPILDAVTDLPIANHLSYECHWIIPETKRGKTTTEHTQLNRGELLNARMQVLSETIKLLDKMYNDPQSPSNIVRNQQLKEMCKGQYGSLIKHAMDTRMIK